MSENEDCIEILLSCCDRERLTDWEVEFLESIAEHPDQLSKKQQETLDKIWERCMG